MPHLPVRKRLTHRKRSGRDMTENRGGEENIEESASTSGITTVACVFETSELPTTTSPVIVSPPSEALVTTGLRKIRCSLPVDWICTADKNGFHFLLLSSTKIKAVQRQILLSYSGQPQAFVHCEPCPLLDEVFRFVHSPVIFSPETIDSFCESSLSLVEVVRQYTVCIGCNLEDHRELWSTLTGSHIDLNPYLESSFKETLRSVSCARLISFESDDVRCKNCLSFTNDFKERFQHERDKSDNN